MYAGIIWVSHLSVNVQSLSRSPESQPHARTARRIMIPQVKSPLGMVNVWSINIFTNTHKGIMATFVGCHIFSVGLYNLRGVQLIIVRSRAYQLAFLITLQRDREKLGLLQFE